MHNPCLEVVNGVSKKKTVLFQKEYARKRHRSWRDVIWMTLSVTTRSHDAFDIVYTGCALTLVRSSMTSGSRPRTSDT